MFFISSMLEKWSLVYSAMWKPAGRFFEKSAYIRKGQIVGEIYPNEKYGLNGRKLRVTHLPVSKRYKSNFISTVHKGKPDKYLQTA